MSLQTEILIGEGQNLRWYILKVVPGKEFSLLSLLYQRLQEAEVSHFFGRALVPVDNVVEKKSNGVEKKSVKRNYPGYIMIEMDSQSDYAADILKGISNVLYFLTDSRGRPVPLSKAEVDRMLNLTVASDKKAKKGKVYTVGEAIKVNDGPFEGFEGVVEQVNEEKARLSVSVSIFGRSTPIELDFGQVEVIK